MFIKLTVCLLLSMFTVLAPCAVKAEEQKTPSIEEQLSEIIQTQKEMNQRLSNLEAAQRNMFNMMRQGPTPPSRPMPPTEDLTKEYKIDIGSSSVRGNQNAKITIVEFSDFQCPFSQRFHPVVSEVLKAYPQDVKYVLKNFPLSFHPQAKPAAKASLAAREQGKYWEMTEALFQNGQSLSDEKYIELAGQIGLNVEKFKKDLGEKDAKWEKLIAEDMEVVNDVEARGTPTFYINGRKTNARDFNSFKAEIDKIIKQ